MGETNVTSNRIRCLTGVFAVLLVLATAGQARAQDGTLDGTVYDITTGDIVRGVEIEIVGTDITTTSDLDGAFRARVPVGTYRIRATAEGYFPVEFEDELTITAAAPAYIDVLMDPMVSTTTEITVTATTIEESSAESALLERRSAPAVSDIISAREISSNGDSDAAGAMSRVVGASTVEGKYLVVRGLSERFSNTQLNGSRLPSTETDRKVVPLDLFPADLIDNIKLEKTFTPDQPGEFAGALVDIETVEFPVGPTLEFSMTQGFNSMTTGKNYLDYPGGQYDWLGFGDSRRHLPSNIPGERVIRGGAFSDFGFTPEQVEVFGESFENVWETRTRDNAYPNQSWSLTAGNSFGNLGIVYAFTYGNKLQNDEIDQSYYSLGETEDDLVEFHDYQINSTTNTVRLGNTLNLAYKLNGNHKLLFKNLFSKNTSDEARFFSGYNSDFVADIRNERLRFIEETLYSGQVAGEHFFSGFGGLVEWRLAYSRADRDEPDMRETLYVFSTGANDFRLRDQTQSGFRQFVETSDKIWEPGFDVSKFLTSGSFTGTLKGGASFTIQDRYFNARRFRFTHRSTSGLDLTQSPETLLSPEFIGPNFEIREDTRATDQYFGDQEIAAGYGMADLQFGSRWRVIGGARVERSEQTLDSFDLFAIDPTVVSTDLDDTDWLPSINVVYAATTRMNVRVAFSQTVNRPNFRELAPFDFTDVTGGFSVFGNPDLVRTKIDNYDVRWEWFTSGTDLVALSVFYKEFEDPIEQTFQPTAQLRLSFVNVDNAQNWGFETEIRQQLGRLSEALSDFSVSANYTFVDSEVKYGDDIDLSLVTSLERPLAGQSRHIFNTAFEYNNSRIGNNSRILYNYVGERISDVGALGLPDIYESGQHLMDFVMRQRIGGEDSPIELKFSIDNILDDEKEFTQGGLPYRVYKRGRTFSIGMSYDFF